MAATVVATPYAPSELCCPASPPADLAPCCAGLPCCHSETEPLIIFSILFTLLAAINEVSLPARGWIIQGTPTDQHWLGCWRLRGLPTGLALDPVSPRGAQPMPIAHCVWLQGSGKFVDEA